MELYVGKYQHERSENFDEFLKAIEVPLVPRKIMTSTNPTITVTKNADDKWTISTHTFLKTVEYVFTPGVPVESEGMGKSENVFTFEGNKIIQKQKAEKYNVEMVREFSEEGLLMTMKHVENGVTATRHFKRMKH